MSDPVCMDNRSDRQKVIDLREDIKQLRADLEFAYKRAKVLADMLGIPVPESPEVTGTILGMVRSGVEELIAERNLFKDAFNGLRGQTESGSDCKRL